MDPCSLAAPTSAIPGDSDNALALQRLAAIAYGSADAVIGETIDGIITDWNPAAERLYGYSAAEVIGQHRSMLIPPDEAVAFEERVRQLARGESIQGLEAVRRTKGGRRIEVSLTISPIWDDDGQIVATSIISRDITARKATEAALATSLELFRVAFANAPIGMILTDPELRPLQVNPALCAMLGCTEDEMLSGDPLVWIHPGDRQANLDAIARALAGETSSYDLEKRYLHRDGHVLWCHLRGALVRDADGTPRYLVGQIEDITARRAAESALTASEERFRVAFEDAAIGMAIVQPDQTIVRVNRASCAILGYSESELLGMTFPAITHPDDLAANADLTARALAGEISSYEMDKRYIRKDGEIVHARLCVSLLRHADGKPRYFLSQIQDITARKLAEAEFAATHLRLRQVLERITDGFYALDRDWRFTYVNAAAEQMLGRPRSELVGESIWETFPPAIETPLYAAYHQALLDGRTTTIELYYPPLEATFEVRVYPAQEGLSVFFRNVTAQQQFIQDLQKSEATFRTLVEQLPVAVYLLEADAEQTPRYFSPRHEQVTGYSLDEAMQRTDHWLRLVHPDDRERVVAELARSQATQTAFSIDYRYIRKDGGVRWIHDHCDAIRDDSGVVFAWLGTMLDITERIEAEAMQGRLAAIVEAASDGILSVDRDGTILSWNRGAENLYGYPTEEAIGKSVLMLRPPEAEDDISESIARVWQGEDVVEEEAIRLTKDGQRILVSLTLFPIRDPQGEIVAISSISRDLTALRQTQDALRLRDRALDATRNGIVITDPTQPDDPIVDANPAFTALTGYDRSEVLGRNCRFLQGPDTDADVIARLRDALAAGNDCVETLLNYRKDGSPFWNDLSIAAVPDANGKVSHFIGVLSDATERKRHEQDLQVALEAAQSGDRAKSQFLAMMSHELRTPLQAVLGYAHFLLHGPSGSLTPEQRDDVNAIQLSAGRMVTLIEQLLDLTRMEAGRLELKLEPVDLSTILDQVEQDVAPMIAEKGLTFTVDLPASMPPIQCDPSRLRQILLNLVGNAVKFTEVGTVTVDVAITSANAQIMVRDTGIGISPEAMPFIFEEFRQVDGSLTRRYGGAGLGLAISKRLAEQMNGAITVESTQGEGSVFTLCLPLAFPTSPSHVA
ncbi:MAG: PAS domain S-box protein [Thermomicrobiales bacterium]